MIQVQGPDGHIYQFPDGTSPQTMTAAMQKRFGGPNSAPAPEYRQPVTEAQLQAFLHPGQKPQPPTPVQDVLRTLPSGAVRAVTGFAGAAGNMQHLGDAASDWIGHRLEDMGVLPKGGMEAGDIISGLARTADPGVRLQGVTGAATNAALQHMGVRPQVAQAAGRVAASPVGPVGLQPSSDALNALVEAASGQPLYQPQTAAGRTVDTAEQLAPALFAPGTALQRGATYTGALAGSAGLGETAHAVAPQYEGQARFLGALGGGAAGGLFTPTTVGQSIYQAARNATPEQLARADALLRWSETNGLKLTDPEAVDYATGGATNLTRVLRTAEGTKEGQRYFAPAMAQRPAQVAAAAGNVFDKIAPAATDPSSLAVRANNAAGGVLDLARQRVNQSATPLYDALPGTQMPWSQGLWRVDPQTGAPSSAYDQLAGNAAYAEALKGFRGDPVLNSDTPIRSQPGTYAQLPDNDLAVVNKVSSLLGDRAEGLKLTGENTRASILGNAKSTADELASALSPDYAKARQTVATGLQAFRDPLQAGPIGRLASSDRAPPQFSALYSDRIQPGAANETLTALKLLDMQDPGLGASLTSQYLRGQLNDALSLNGAAQPNQWGGSRFVSSALGNPEQAAAVQGGVAQVAPNAAADFGNLTDALAATGTRQRVNYAQEGAREDRLDWERGANLATRLGRGLIDIPGAFGEARDLLDRWRMGKTGGEFGQLWTGPVGDQIAARQRALAAGTPNTAGDALVRALLQYQPLLAAAQQPQPQQ